MSINFQIPDKSRLIPTSTTFSSDFSSPTPGVYDFTNYSVNQNVKIIDMQPNTTYFIDRVSVGGNITEQQFLESVNEFPKLFLKRKIGKKNIYTTPIPITNFIDSGQLSNFFFTDKLGDCLEGTFEGVLNQLASMIGIATVRIQISFQIWAIDSAYYNSAFRDSLADSIGQSNRR